MACEYVIQSKEEKRQIVKLKMLYLAKIFYDETSRGHGLTIEEIQDRLAKLEMGADRTSLYRDIRALSEFGMTIEKQHTRPERYFLESRLFSAEEVQLILDAVWTMKFMNHHEAEALDAKIRTLVGKYDRGALSGDFDLPLRRRSTVEYAPTKSLRAVQVALREGKNISFKYMDFNEHGRRVSRGNRRLRTLVPLSITLSDANYYVMGWEKDSPDEDLSEHNFPAVKHFRIDRMDNVTYLYDTSAAEKDMRKKFRETELKNHLKHAYFGMFQANVGMVQLLVTGQQGFNILYDKFGFKGDDSARMDVQDMIVSPYDEGFIVTLKVPLSQIFFGWLASMYPVLQLQGPPQALDAYKDFLNERVQSLT